MKYGWKYYFEPTPLNVGRWLLALKGALVTVATSAFFSNHENEAFWILFATGLLNEIGNMFSDTPPPANDQPNNN